jgi:molybdopterin/thiamine biosynthesis adenylyltransferase
LIGESASPKIWTLNGDLLRLRDGTFLVLGVDNELALKPAQGLHALLQELVVGVSFERLNELKKTTFVASLIDELGRRRLFVPQERSYQDSALHRTQVYLSRMTATMERPFIFDVERHFVILGCGGLGANVAYFLVCAGFRRFTLVDGDSVEASNLNRQFPLSRDQIGLRKVDALAQLLRAHEPALQIRTVCQWIHSESDLEAIFSESPPDFIVCGIDSPPLLSRVEVTRYARRHSIASIFGGVGYRQITIGPLLTSTSACDAFLSELARLGEKLDTDSSGPVAGSLPTTNALGSAFAANEIIAFVYGLGEPVTHNAKIIFDPFCLNIEHRIVYG